MHISDISEQEFVRLRAESRKAGFSLPAFDPAKIESMGWADLHSVRSNHTKAARKLLDSIKDGISNEEARELEKAHDAAIAVFDAIKDEMDLREAFGTKEPLTASQRGRPIGDDRSTSGQDGGYAVSNRGGWQEKDGTEIRVLSQKDAMATERYNGPSLGTVLRAMITGPRNDDERRALSEGTDSAGGYTVPAPLAAEFIDKLRARSVVMSAGARTVPMASETLAIARLETDPDMAWRAENAAVGESDPTFARVLLEAKSMAGLVKVSRELLEDSVNVSEALENAFVQSAALEFDLGCLYGTGASNQPEGLGVTSGINSVSMGTNGAALTDYDEIIDMIYEMQVDNAGDPTAMIYHPRTGAALAKLKDANNNPLTVPEMVARVPKLVTTSVPIDQTQGTAVNASSILAGDFTKMLVGLRNSLRIEILKERYADNLQYGFLAFMRGDVQFAHKASFTKLIGVIPPA